MVSLHMRMCESISTASTHSSNLPQTYLVQSDDSLDANGGTGHTIPESPQSRFLVVGKRLRNVDL
jgi:hypothetical protein